MKHICWKAVAGFSFLVWSMPAMAETVPMVRLAELEIAPENIEAYKAHLREEIEVSMRSEPGVLMLYAVAVRGRPNQIRLTEVYADQAAYDAHVRSAHFLKYKMATANMVRSLTLTDTDPILLESKSLSVDWRLVCFSIGTGKRQE
jgi:quinol monooxygenase YgiN